MRVVKRQTKSFAAAQLYYLSASATACGIPMAIIITVVVPSIRAILEGISIIICVLVRTCVVSSCAAVCIVRADLRTYLRVAVTSSSNAPLS